MNRFNELKKYILPYYPIFEYKGQEIYNAIFENLGATAAPNYYMFSDRLRNISSIVRAKAFKTRYEKHGEHKPDFREIIEDLCDNNVELADEIFEILNTAVSIDTSIRNFRSRNKFYDGKVGISVENINKLVSGPVYYGQSYDDFITSSISFKSEELNNIFFNEVILSFEDPIYFTSGSFERLEVKDESLAYLNKMIIFKSNAIDMVKLPTGAYMLCVDVHKRFKDGDLIKTDSSWIFSQNYSRFSVVIIN
jgi:hypothetical protein